MKPYVLDPDTVTYSMFSAYLKCPASFEKMYGPNRIPWQERVPIGSLIAGADIHEIIEESEPNDGWRYGRALLVERFREKFAADVAEAQMSSGHMTVWAGAQRNVRDEATGKEIKGPDGKALKSNEDYAWWMNHGCKLMLGNYVETRMLDEDQGIKLVPGGTEMRLRVTLPDGKTLRVTIDAFMYANTLTGEPKLRDWKTGQIGRADEKQLAIYFYAAREADLGLPELEFCYLRALNVEKRLKVVKLNTLADYVPAWFSWFQANVEMEAFPPFPSLFNCKGCQVKPWCPAGSALYGKEVEAE